jgi:cell division protease FtsH
MKRWWRRNRHLLIGLLLILAVLIAAAGSALVMRGLLAVAGFAVNLSMVAATMVIQVVFYFGFIFYYLGGVKMVKVMPGEAGEMTLEDDYWGQPELVEVARQWVSLLEDPTQLREMGGQPITGVLLSGPPGSGKTHLARCMAGSAAVPFLGLDGSRLISMWLGVGSIKVMRLFANARKYARRYGACIVFVDELDAIGSSRGSVQGGQTQAGMLGGVPTWGGGLGVLNTLLTQMDGINEQRNRLLARWYKLRGKKMPPPDYTVFVMGATNRPAVLDPALTRAGRLDVLISVDPTDRVGRTEIIRNYLKGLETIEPIDVEGFAGQTTGLTPADLKTIITRRAPARALFAGRAGLANEDLRASLAEQSLGLRQPIASMRALDKRAIAYHEAGHAVTTWALTDDVIARVSIIRYSGGPRGGASLGHVSPVPEEERWNQSLREVENKICAGLGGRAAELEFLGQAHTGAIGDLSTARHRLKQLADEGHFGSLGYKQEPSDQLVKEMDELYARLLERARSTLRTHRAKVEALVEALLEHEELDAEAAAAILGERPKPQGDTEKSPGASDEPHQGRAVDQIARLE